MFAIVDIDGHQYKVEKDQKIYVHRLKGDIDSKLEFDRVLLIDKDEDVKIGRPYIENARVVAQILEHLKADKIKVFKKKRRKGYKVLKGHRQLLTRIIINEIIDNTEKKQNLNAKTEKTTTLKK